MGLMQRSASGWRSYTTGSDVMEDEESLLSINYALEIDGLLAGYFMRLIGGEMEVAVIQHNVTFETGDSTTLMIPGPITFKPIQLTRGFGFSNQFYSWLGAVVNGDMIQARRNGSITLNQRQTTTSDTGASVVEYVPVMRWNLYDVWISSISGFDYNQYTDAVFATLVITLVAETIERVEP